MEMFQEPYPLSRYPDTSLMTGINVDDLDSVEFIPGSFCGAPMADRIVLFNNQFRASRLFGSGHELTFVPQTNVIENVVSGVIVTFDNLFSFENGDEPDPVLSKRVMRNAYLFRFREMLCHLVCLINDIYPFPLIVEDGATAVLSSVLSLVSCNTRFFDVASAVVCGDLVAGRLEMFDNRDIQRLCARQSGIAIRRAFHFIRTSRSLKRSLCWARSKLVSRCYNETFWAPNGILGHSLTSSYSNSIWFNHYSIADSKMTSSLQASSVRAMSEDSRPSTA